MMFGNLAAQGILFASAPIITRLYQPDNFGLMTLIASVTGLCALIVSLRFDQSIVLPKSEKDAVNLVALCLISAASITGLLCLIALLAQSWLPEIIEEYGLAGLVWFIPLGALFIGLNNIFTHWQARHKNFSLISASRVASPTAAAVLKIAMGMLAGSSAFWLIFGNVFGFAVGASMLGFFFFRKNFADFKSRVEMQSIKVLAGRYREFPKFGVWTGLLNNISQNVPIFLFGYYFSNEVVGFYGLANSVLKRPIMLISQSLTTVFLQKAAESYADGKDVNEWLKKTTFGLAVVGLLPFGILLFAGDDLFRIIFGKEWSESGYYVQILTPWLYMAFINPPSTQILIVKQKLRFTYYWNLLNIMIKTAVFYAGYIISPNARILLALFSITGVLTNIYYVMYAFKISKS
jgi:O-antigen/teichoic acid export membrane protein